MARNSFYTKIKGKDKLTPEEKEIKRLYEELDEKYKAKSVSMQNYEEYKAWCEEHGKKPKHKQVKAAQKGEQETEEQREHRLAMARNTFYIKIKGKDELTLEERSVHIQDTLDMITANEERAAGREVPQQTTYEETNITTKKKERNYER